MILISGTNADRFAALELACRLEERAYATRLSLPLVEMRDSLLRVDDFVLVMVSRASLVDSRSQLAALRSARRTGTMILVLLLGIRKEEVIQEGSPWKALIESVPAIELQDQAIPAMIGRIQPTFELVALSPAPRPDEQRIAMLRHKLEEFRTLPGESSGFYTPPSSLKSPRTKATRLIVPILLLLCIPGLDLFDRTPAADLPAHCRLLPRRPGIGNVAPNASMFFPCSSTPVCRTEVSLTQYS